MFDTSPYEIKCASLWPRKKTWHMSMKIKNLQTLIFFSPSPYPLCSIHHNLSLFPLLSFPSSHPLLSSFSLTFLLSHVCQCHLLFPFPSLISFSTHPLVSCSHLLSSRPNPPSSLPVSTQFYSNSYSFIPLPILLPSCCPPMRPSLFPSPTSSLPPFHVRHPHTFLSLVPPTTTCITITIPFSPSLQTCFSQFLTCFSQFLPLSSISHPFSLCSHSFTQLPSPFIQVSYHFLLIFTSSLDANTFLLYCFLRNSLDVPETNALVFANQVCTVDQQQYAFMTNVSAASD